PPDAISFWRWLSSTCSPRPSTSRRSSSSNATHELRPPSYPFRIQLARRREPDLRDGPPRRRDGHASNRADGPWRPLWRGRSVSPGKGRGHQPDHRPGSLRRDALAPSERRPSRSGSLSPDPAGQKSGRLSQLDQAIQPGAPRGLLLQASNRKALLAEHTEGLIALSSCLGGEVASRLLEGDEAGAEQAAREYQRMVGE